MLKGWHPAFKERVLASKNQMLKGWHPAFKERVLASTEQMLKIECGI
jgi:hypothetical protein